MNTHWPLITALSLLACVSGCQTAQDPGKVVKTIEATGYVLTIFDNSDTLSQASAVNAHGHVVGVRETTNEDQTIFTQQHFFSDGQESIDIPLLDKFTNTSVSALSDNDRVVGYASRPIGHPEGSLTAIVWDAATRTIVNLGSAPGDETSHAQDISADGKRITGYTVGSRPARMRPCVWEYQENDKSWRCEALPTKEAYNPFLQTGSVVISPDGKLIAACITENTDAAGNIDNALYAWKWDDGKWRPRKLSDDYLKLKDINNAGKMVGDTTAEANRIPVLVSPEGEFTALELLPGDVSGIAHGINEADVVVGHSDDPVGPEGGPQAFIWEDGQTRPIVFPETTEFSMALAINNQGQIVGLADITFDETGPKSSGAAEQPAQSEADSKDAPDSTEEPLVKTLAYLRTPTTDNQATVKTIKQ